MNVPMNQNDFVLALKNVQKSVSSIDLNRHAKWMEDFGAAV